MLVHNHKTLMTSEIIHSRTYETPPFTTETLVCGIGPIILVCFHQHHCGWIYVERCSLSQLDTVLFLCPPIIESHNILFDLNIV
jgi:hypothetical protein